MKHLRKLASLLLALVMIFSLATTAFADENTITVNNAKNGETYKAYKMFDLVVDDVDNPTAYSYTVNDAWADFFEDSHDEWKAVFVKDAQGYITAKDDVGDETEWSATSALSVFAEAAAQYAKKLTHVDTKVASGTSVVLTTKEPGYYLITSTLGSRAMIDTTPGDVTINEKNPVDTISKEVKEDDGGTWGKKNDAQIGDTVEFKSTVTIQPRSINVKIHDTMDTGLDFTTGSIKIYTNVDCTTALDATYYQIQGTPDEEDTFTIQIKDDFAATAEAAQTLYITYEATLNENAVIKNENGVAIVDRYNRTHVSYGDNTNSTEDTTTTTTHKFSVHKYAAGSKEKNLAGAKFQLKKDNAVVALFKIDDNNYRIAVTGDDPAKVVTEFITVADGNIVIWGVDADKDYTLKEITPPAGYNPLTEEKEVAVSANNDLVVDVENNAGTELPSTGGMGTTLFYVVGGILVAAAAVLLVTKKRMSSAE